MSDTDKEVMKEAMKEWLNEQYATVGRWTVRAFIATLFIASCYLIVMVNGWHK